MNDSKNWLEAYKALVDDAFRNASLDTRQTQASAILSKALELFPGEDFQKLQDYVFEKLEK